MLKIPSVKTTYQPAPRKPVEGQEKLTTGGKIQKAVSAAIQLPGRIIATTAQILGHLSEGDVESVKKVPTIFENAVKLWNEAGPSSRREALRGLESLSEATATLYHGVGKVLPQALGYISAGDTKTAKNLLMDLDKPIRENQNLMEFMKKELNTFYSDYGPGVSYLTYKDKDGKIATSKVSNEDVKQRINQIQKSGGSLVGVDVTPEANIKIGGWQTKTNLNTALAFATEVADPVLAGIYGRAIGKGMRVGASLLKGSSRVAKQIPGVEKAIEYIGDLAGQITSPGSRFDKMMQAIETHELFGMTLRNSTKKIRDKYTFEARQARAMQAQIKEQAESVAALLKTNNKLLDYVSQTYLDNLGKDGGLPAVKRYLAGGFLINHGLVLTSIEDTAKVITKLKNLKAPQREELLRLAHDMATGDSINENILARVAKAMDAGLPPPVDSPELQKAFAVLSRVEKKAADWGLSMDDVRVFSNALRLPKSGLGVRHPELYDTLTDFAEILKGNIPKRFALIQGEADELIKRFGVDYEILNPANKELVGSGMKAIETATALGLSEEGISQMRKALAVAGDRKLQGNLEILVRKFDDYDKLISDDLVVGPKVPQNKREMAARIREAVRQEASEQGFDPDVVETIAKMGRKLDEQWGLMEVDLGIISREQFDKMRGLHIRRMYNMEGVEARLEEISKLDSAKADRLRVQYESLLADIDTVHRSGIDIGGIGTSIAKRREQLTPEFRNLLDEVNNISDAITLSGRRAANDISTATFYKMVNKTGLAQDSWAPGHKKLIGSTWGELNGKYVPEIVYADLTRAAKEMHSRPSELTTWWSKYVIRPFKLANVVYYPAARLHNAVSNAIAVSIALDTTSVPALIEHVASGIKSILARDMYFIRYSRYSPSIRESSLILNEQFSSLSKMGNGGLLENTLLGRAYKFPQQTMAWEESAAKMAIFKQAVKPKAQGGLGMTDREGVLLAEKWMIDYGDVPPIVDYFRRRIGVFPFLTYSYKMIGNLAKLPYENPRIMTKHYQLYEGLVGLTSPDKRELERVGLPEWLEENLIIRLPGKEPRYFNLDPYVPWNIFDVDALEGAAMPLRIAWQNLGQPYKGIIDIAVNKNTFNGAPIVPEGTDPVTAAELRYKYLSEQVGQIRLARKLQAAVYGKPLSVTTKPQRWYDVLLDVRDIDIDKTAELRYKQKNAELQRAIGRAEKALNNEALDEARRTELFDRQMLEADRIRTELKEIQNGLVKLRGARNLLTDSNVDPDQIETLIEFLTSQPMPDKGIRMKAQEMGERYNDGTGFNMEAMNMDYQNKLIAIEQEMMANMQNLMQIPHMEEPMAIPSVDMRQQRPNSNIANKASEAMGEDVNPALPQAGKRVITPSLP